MCCMVFKSHLNVFFFLFSSVPPLGQELCFRADVPLGVVDAAEVFVGEGGTGSALELPVAVAALPVRHAHVVLLAVEPVGVVPERLAQAAAKKNSNQSPSQYNKRAFWVSH